MPIDDAISGLEDKRRIMLTPEQETLLIPLYCKALKDNSILSDEKSRDILDHIEWDYSQLHIPRKTCIMMCLRARQFDAYTRGFLADYPGSIVAHLGCGLDSRYDRINNGEVEWYDLDMPAVIDLREKFYTETGKHHMLPSSVTELDWINSISSKGRAVLVIAEGLFMYLNEAEVRELILTLQRAFPGCLLIFDAYSRFTAKRVKGHPSIKNTGANVQWGIDDAGEIEHWNNGIRLKEERYFAQFDGINRLNRGYSFAFRLSGLFPIIRRAHRILYYTLS
jgi:O-methyltransferase involved in polyketide biosynthesis